MSYFIAEGLDIASLYQIANLSIHTVGSPVIQSAHLRPSFAFSSAPASAFRRESDGNRLCLLLCIVELVPSLCVVSSRRSFIVIRRCTIYPHFNTPDDKGPHTRRNVHLLDSPGMTTKNVSRTFAPR